MKRIVFSLFSIFILISFLSLGGCYTSFHVQEKERLPSETVIPDSTQDVRDNYSESFNVWMWWYPNSYYLYPPFSSRLFPFDPWYGQYYYPYYKYFRYPRIWWNHWYPWYGNYWWPYTRYYPRNYWSFPYHPPSPKNDVRTRERDTRLRDTGERVRERIGDRKPPTKINSPPKNEPKRKIEERVRTERPTQPKITPPRKESSEKRGNTQNVSPPRNTQEKRPVQKNPPKRESESKKSSRDNK